MITIILFHEDGYVTGITYSPLLRKNTGLFDKQLPHQQDCLYAPYIFLPYIPASSSNGTIPPPLQPRHTQIIPYTEGTTIPA